jgi:glutamine synthetase-like protein
MLWYIGGLLTHVDSLLAICAPTTNSYKHLVPHSEAPVNVAFSACNRSAAVRIPMYYQGNPKAKRLEFRPPDPSCNPYLAFSALLCAGLDRIKAGRGGKPGQIGVELPYLQLADGTHVPAMIAPETSAPAVYNGKTRNAPSFLSALSFAKGQRFHVSAGVVGVTTFCTRAARPWSQRGPTYAPCWATTTSPVDARSPKMTLDRQTTAPGSPPTQRPASWASRGRLGAGRGEPFPTLMRRQADC